MKYARIRISSSVGSTEAARFMATVLAFFAGVFFAFAGVGRGFAFSFFADVGVATESGLGALVVCLVFFGTAKFYFEVTRLTLLIRFASNFSQALGDGAKFSTV
jgi:ABC-type amino acid transport system permease subunit